MKGYHIDYSGMKITKKKADNRHELTITRKNAIITIPVTGLKLSGFIKYGVLKLIKDLTPENILKLDQKYGVKVKMIPLAA